MSVNDPKRTKPYLLEYKLKRIGSLPLLLLFLAQLSFAGTVNIKGSVKFNDGKIPHTANIGFFEKNGNYAKSLNADDAGLFSLADVPYGKYSIIVFGIYLKPALVGTLEEQIIIDGKTKNPLKLEFSLVGEPN